MDISDVLELIDEISDFSCENEEKPRDFVFLREDEIEKSNIKIKTNTVPRIIP